jgi:hypothetical protein
MVNDENFKKQQSDGTEERKVASSEVRNRKVAGAEEKRKLYLLNYSDRM